jgi:hypothetical protein
VNIGRSAVAEALPAYEIGGELGRGAWGVVLAGRHHHLRRDVAIKQLPPAFGLDVNVRSRFVAEARLLASLDHPHIVPVYDFIDRDGLCLLVMERLSGGTVWDRFAREGIDTTTACAIALVTAVAMDHAHGRGVLHRDIKPENLLFSGDGALLKVADFGIAKVLAGGQTLATSAGEVLGTPAYMAPEQATGGEIVPATDVYALGVTLFEMLSGRLPFAETGSALAALYQRVNEPPLELGEVAPDVPEPLHAVVMTAIATSPENRYLSANAFAVALAEAATAAFGRGWLDRAGIRAVLGGPIAALTEREPPSRTTARSVAPVRPRATARGPGSPLVAGPDDLVPVAELQAPDQPAPLKELRLLLSRSAQPDAQRLAMEIERAEASAHELKELSLLKQIRSGTLPLSGDELATAERLLGAAGPKATNRLGLPEDASTDDVRRAAQEQAEQWGRRAENPLSSRAVVEAARVLVRTCEGILADMPSTGGPPRSS